VTRSYRSWQLIRWAKCVLGGDLGSCC